MESFNGGGFFIKIEGVGIGRRVFVSVLGKILMILVEGYMNLVYGRRGKIWVMGKMLFVLVLVGRKERDI